MRSAIHSPVLVLNASYEPLHVCAARRALTLIVKDAAHIQEHAGREVHAGIMFPTVIRLKAYRKVPHRAQVLTRRNILVRDGYQCQYCGSTFSAMELTLDHVIPRSRGGLSTWENLVACCSADNRRKADRTPEEAGMPLLRIQGLSPCTPLGGFYVRMQMPTESGRNASFSTTWVAGRA